MSKDPLVSIIITSYNYSQFLREAIDSALQQTYPHKEVIVVDDGSTDNSTDIIKSYGTQIQSIFKENGGQASAFNAGFKASKGDIIIFLDSDDVLKEEAAAEAVPLFADDEVVKVHWMVEEMDVDGNKTNKIYPVQPLSEGLLKEDVLRLGPSRCGGPPNSPPTSGNAWSRRFLKYVFPIPEDEYKTCTDQYLQVLAPVYGQIRKIELPLSDYRVHGQNYSLNPLDTYMHEFLERFEQSCRILNDHLLNRGHEVHAHGWLRDSWFHRIKASIEDILKIVPEGGSFILVDGNEWGLPDTIEGRKRVHFIGRDNTYWGLPENDDQAIEEIERQRKEGAAYLFFTWTTFWYLDFYAGMHQYLKSKYENLLQLNPRLTAFKLQEA